MDLRKVREKLMAYRALDNPHRLRAFVEIAREQGVYFNDLARKLGIERGLLAYHVGVLYSAGLVDRLLERRSKQTSKYMLTEKGERILRELSSKSRREKGRR